MHIPIRYSLTKPEYLEAFDTYERSVNSYVFDKMLSLALILIGGGLLWGAADLSNVLFASAAIALGLVTFVDRWRVSRLIVGLRFDNSPQLFQEQAILFGHDGLDYEARNVKSHIRWDLYTMALVSQRTLILVYGPRLYTVFPKKAFAEGDLEELLTFLGDKVRRTNRQHQTPG